MIMRPLIKAKRTLSCSRAGIPNWGRRVVYVAGSLLVISMVLMVEDLTRQQGISLRRKILAERYTDHTTARVQINEIKSHIRHIEKNVSSQSNRSLHTQITNQSFIKSPSSADKSIIFGPIIGRLGNEIFQYVAQYMLAKKTGRINGLDPKSVLPRLFTNITGDLESVRDTPHKTVSEAGAGIFSSGMIGAVANATGNVAICCYFQSWKYMEGHEQEVRKLLTIRPDILDTVDRFISKQARQILDVWRKEGLETSLNSTQDFTYIGVHVRNADMSLGLSQKRGYALAPLSYILKAMQYYRENYRNAVFFVSSDNLSWCMENLKTRGESGDEDVVFVLHRPVSELYDFATLVRCNHTVVTSGTFGWWAGWLAGGTVVYYSGYPTPNTEIGRQYNASDYYPKWWIPMT